jgi:hypothetical protein
MARVVPSELTVPVEAEEVTKITSFKLALGEKTLLFFRSRHCTDR